MKKHCHHMHIYIKMNRHHHHMHICNSYQIAMMLPVYVLTTFGWLAQVRSYLHSVHFCFTVIAVPFLGFKVSVQKIVVHVLVHRTHTANKLSSEDLETRNISSWREGSCGNGKGLKKRCVNAYKTTLN